MGFWDVTKRLVIGQPAFQEPPKPNEWSDNDEPTADYADEVAAKREEHVGLRDAHGVKQIPEAAIRSAKYDLSGDHVEVWATIHNASDRVIELDKIMVAGQKWELDYVLQPGAEREFSVYKGAVLTHNSYNRAELYYKDQATGDYFCANHIVQYDYHAQTKTYNIVGMTIMRPIRDV